MAWDVSIKHEIRPCYICTRNSEKTKALFHGWFQMSETSSPEGAIARPAAIVELEDGSVMKIRPEQIRFVPGIFNDYCWEE